MKPLFFVLFTLYCLNGTFQTPQQADDMETVIYKDKTIPSLTEMICSIEVVRLAHQGKIVIGESSVLYS